MSKKQVMLTTFLLVCVVFVIGVITGNYWNSGQTQVSKILKQSELDTESFIVEQELFESFETNCALAEKRLGTLSEELWKLGKILGGQDAEEQLGEENYNFLKRKFHLTQIRTYILDKKLQSDCGSKTNIILYYYKKGDQASEQQGKILDELVTQHDIHIFALEYRYSKELEFLEDYYEIKDAPTLVINFQHVLHGNIPKDQIIPLLHG